MTIQLCGCFINQCHQSIRSTLYYELVLLHRQRQRCAHHIHFNFKLLVGCYFTSIKCCGFSLISILSLMLFCLCSCVTVALAVHCIPSMRLPNAKWISWYVRFVCYDQTHCINTHSVCLHIPFKRFRCDCIRARVPRRCRDCFCSTVLTVCMHFNDCRVIRFPCYNTPHPVRTCNYITSNLCKFAANKIYSRSTPVCKFIYLSHAMIHCRCVCVCTVQSERRHYDYN